MPSIQIHKLAWIGTAVGAVSLLAYLNFAFGWVELSRRLSLVLAFSIGPAGIVGILGMTKRLAARHDKETLNVGAVFLIIAFSILTLMLTVQQALFAEYYKAALEIAPENTSTLKQTYSLVNQVQLGADVAFDIFYCIGLLVVSRALLSVAGFPRLLGIYGIVSAVCLLGLNIWTFPVGPKYAGALDLGPASVLWWVGLIVLNRRVKNPGSA